MEDAHTTQQKKNNAQAVRERIGELIKGIEKHGATREEIVNELEQLQLLLAYNALV